jgi:hypothetical protein
MAAVAPGGIVAFLGKTRLTALNILITGGVVTVMAFRASVKGLKPAGARLAFVVGRTR